MDADAAVNKDVAARYQVRSYPTIKFFPKGSDKGMHWLLVVGLQLIFSLDAIPYEVGRSEADFVKFLNEHCGTQRAVGGGLNELVRSHHI